MIKLKEYWSRAEKWAIFTTLLIYFVLHFLAKFSDTISKEVVEKRGDVLIISLVLIFLFKFIVENLGTLEKQALENLGTLEKQALENLGTLEKQALENSKMFSDRLRVIDEKLKTLDEPVLKISNTFLEGLREILNEEKYYENVDIIAHTGVVYVGEILRGCEARIKNLRVLVKDIENISLPVTPNDKCKLRTEWGHAEIEWQLLKKKKLPQQDTPQITNLCIRCYPFDPMMTFIIVDRKKAYFDLMAPQIEYPGSTSVYDPTSYTITDRTEAGGRLINNMWIVFNHMWNDFTKEVNLVKPPIDVY